VSLNDLVSLWHTHQNDGWPKFSSPNEGELMTLDTVISGCVTYYLESEDGLDPQRIDMLESCLGDLDGLLPELADDASAYFERLRTLASFLLEAHQRQ